MRWALIIAAIEAGATGLLLIVSPPLFARLVLGSELTDPGQAVGHLGGLVLLSLALACWPTTGDCPTLSSLRAMLFYELDAGYLVHLGTAGKLVGVLLWPAAALHAVLTILLSLAWFQTMPSGVRVH
jgi:hypothetical protein